MTTKKQAAQKNAKEAKALTLEQRVELIERALQFLGVKLRTHGIHLDADPEPENVNAYATSQAEEE